MSKSPHRIRPTPERGPPRGFDWTNIWVGHWLVGDHKPGKGGRTVWVCASACGVRTVFRGDALAAGGTKYCEACRGDNPPASRVATGETLAAIRDIFEMGLINVDIESNLRGADCVADWERHAEPLFYNFIDRTGLGRAFGWKVKIRDAHRRKGEQLVRVRGWHDSTRRAELSVCGREYLFEVDLATGRTDRPWADIRRAIEAGLAPEVKVAAVGTPAPAPATDRLMRLRSGIDKVIELQAEKRAGEELVAEIRQRVAAIEKEVAPLRDAHERAGEAVADLAKRTQAAKELADERQNQLRVAVELRDKLVAELAQAKTAHQAANDRYSPVAGKLSSAYTELNEAERMEQERVKAMDKVGDLSLLLAALENLGVS